MNSWNVLSLQCDISASRVMVPELKVASEGQQLG